PVRWGAENENKTFKVFSNCQKVELYLNETSLGAKQRMSEDFPAAGLHWEGQPKQGLNKLRAVSIVKTKFNKDSLLTDSVEFDYQTQKWGEVAQLVCTSTILSENERWVEAQLCDNSGVRCLDAKDFIEFEIAGDDILVKNLGTSSGSYKVQAQNGKARIKVAIKGKNSVVSIKTAKARTQFLQIK
ncbi:MAG: DUF4982 domain-containing protein, partial [Bacteroidia bacterium]|nr:DUF4982 domain-containing protein [Bacteroidia bacterium]